MKYKVVDLSGRVRALSDSYSLASAYRDYLCSCGVSAFVFALL